MKRKILSVVITLALVLAVATPIFAWFYFPNSKGLEINTPEAEDFSVTMYKLENEYNTDGTFKRSYFVNLAEYGDENEENLYLTSNGFEVNETFEFFEWGDEYICENSEPKYYAIECEYDSDIFNDGYVKSVLSTTLSSVGIQVDAYEEGDPKVDLAFPMVNVSYKYASISSIMSSDTTAVNEIKSSTGYQDVVSRYCKKDGNNYIELDENTFDSTLTKIYKRNLTEFTGTILENNVTYYEISYGQNGDINYNLKNDTVYDSEKRYFVGTFDEVSSFEIDYSSNSTYNYIFEDNKSKVFYTDLLAQQYINSTTEKLQFVLFIKVEPNESLVTDVMDRINGKISDELTELVIDNKLQFDVKLRTVPKKAE